MKRKIILFVILAFASLSMVTHADETELLIVTGDYPPLVYKNNFEKSIFLNIVREVFAAAGYKTAVKYYPWPRCEYMLEIGQAFASLPYTKNTKRLEYAVFSDFILNEELLAVVSTRNFGKKTITFSDLKKIRIGSVTGFYYDRYINQYEILCDYSTSEEEVLFKLFNGRYDTAIVNIYHAGILVKSKFPEHKNELKRFEISKLKVPYYLMASKKYPQSQKIISDFNRSLQKYKNSGDYEKYILEYRNYTANVEL